MKILRIVRSWLAKKPENKLTWSREDYELGRKWAKGQPHTLDPNKSLWDEVYEKRGDATWTLYELNKKL